MELLGHPRALVFNKIDLLNPTAAQNLCMLHDALGVSALERSTTRPLLQLIQAQLGVELMEWAEAINTPKALSSPEALSIQVWDEGEVDEEAHDEDVAPSMSDDEAQELATYYQSQYQQPNAPEESATERRARRRKAEDEEDFWAD
jgi:hypothetical protein